MRISVITTKRAYDELEKEGFIYTVAAKGCFVAERNRELIREEYLRKTEELLSEAFKAAKTAGITKGEIMNMINLLTEEEKF